MNPGGSGALMWFSQNHEFVIKTVAREQSNFLYKMLRGYYLNMDQNPNTLLTKFYGLYTLKQNGKRIRVVVMKNFFPKDVVFDQKFDLKVRFYESFANFRIQSLDYLVKFEAFIKSQRLFFVLLTYIFHNIEK